MSRGQRLCRVRERRGQGGRSEGGGRNAESLSKSGRVESSAGSVKGTKGPMARCGESAFMIRGFFVEDLY